MSGAEAIATGATVAEACEQIGITRDQWSSWRRRKPEVEAMHAQAMAAKAEAFEDQIASMHDDLTVRAEKQAHPRPGP